MSLLIFEHGERKEKAVAGLKTMAERRLFVHFVGLQDHDAFALGKVQRWTFRSRTRQTRRRAGADQAAFLHKGPPSGRKARP